MNFDFISIYAYLLVVGLTVINWYPLRAQCSCTKRSLQEEKELATEIFIGRVLSKEINSTDIGYVDQDRRGTLTGIRNKVKVVETYKGALEARDTVSILTGDSTNPCAYSFDLNQYYLIYSRYQFTNECRRTKKLSARNDEEVHALLGSDSSLVVPPFVPNTQSSLTEKAYFSYRVTYPIIIPAACDSREDGTDCIRAVSEEISAYFYQHISRRMIRQTLVLYINDDGELSINKVIPRIGQLTQEEEKEILSFFRENYVFVTKGYGELMRGGITHVLLSNEEE